MLARLKHALAPPVMVDEDQNRSARIVHTIIVALLLVALGVIAADLATDYLAGIPSLIMGSGLVLVAWGLLRRGHLPSAGLLVLLTLLGVVTVELYRGQGIHDPAVIAYPVMVILASVVFDRRYFIAFTVLALLSLGGIVLAELLGLVYEAFPGATSWYDFAVAASILILAAIGTRLLADDLMHSLSESRHELAERARIEAALRDSEARYRTFVEQSTDGLMLIDEAGLISEWNHAQEIITGLTRAEVLGCPQWAVQSKMAPPDKRTPELEARWQATILDALKTGQSPLFSRVVDAVLLTPTGERRHIQQSIFPIQTGHGWRLGAITLDVTDRKQMEETLRQSEASLAEAQRISHFGSWTWDLTTGKLQCSDEMFRIAGLSPQEIEVTQEVFLRFLHPDDVAWMLRQIQSGLAGNLPASLEHRLVRPNGEVQHVYSHAKVYYDEHGRPLRVLGSTQDISERKLAEAALQESEQRFRAIFNSVNDAIFVHDPETGAILDVNDKMCEMYGCSHDEACQLAIADISANVPPYTQAEAMRWIKHAAQGEAALFEWHCKTRAGQLFWTEVNMRRATLGQRVRVLVAARDITWRKQAEAALRASEDRFRSLVQNASDVITVHQADGTITYESPSAARVLGYGEGGLIGQRPIAIIHPDDAALLQANWQEVAAQRNDGLPTELRFRRADGEWLYLEVIGKNLLDQPGIRGIVVTARNVTERKRAEAEREELFAELAKRNTELERFTYTVSHDLKAPLITIKGFLGFLEQDALAGNVDRLKSDITRIGNAATKMERLLSELLELSRIGRLMNPPQRVPFESLAREAAELVAGRLTARGVTVTIAPDLGDVYGDRARLVEVVQNLIDNAAKFMGDQPQPQIEIGVRAAAEARVFYVKDNGLGIEPQYRERVFGLFDKLDPHGEGTGIGLALVKRIIEVHGGRIWVESNGAGTGSTFCFTLAERSMPSG